VQNLRKNAIIWESVQNLFGSILKVEKVWEQETEKVKKLFDNTLYVVMKVWKSLLKVEQLWWKYQKIEKDWESDIKAD